ncbi:unnamed protein product [Pylaiella littoralis]
MVDGLVQLITGRFLVLLLHAVTTMLLFYGKTPLVWIELDPNQADDDRKEQYEYIDRWMTALLTLATICMAVEFVGLLSGRPRSSRLRATTA